MRPLLLVLLLGLLAPPAAALEPEDREALISVLRVLRSGYDGEAAATADRILEDPEAPVANYDGFFAEFVSEDPLTGDLARFLVDRALRGGSAASRTALQEALARLAAREIDNSLRTHLPDRMASLAADASRLEHLRSCLELLGRIAFEGDLARESRTEHYARLRGLIAAHPVVLRNEARIDLVGRPKLAAIRAHLFKILRDLLLPFDAERFIADTGFSGDHAELVRRHGVLLLDNHGLDPRQRQAIRDLLSLVPRRLHLTRHISVHDLLGNWDGETAEMPFLGSPGFNLFATPLGPPLGNPFPGDVDPVWNQGFCGLLQHELNHMVDGYAVGDVPSRSRRRAQLIAQAGSDPMQYLRSMLEPGYFATYPQEFFASIANQYFSDSFQTLRLALRRFEAGWREPINQFLFFADVYSQGGAATLFVVQNGDCEYSAHSIPIGRDRRGRIDRIELPGTTLRFELDDAGNVVR